MGNVSPPGNSTDTHSDDQAVEQHTPSTEQRQFPPTLVGLDPPTLPASDQLAAHGVADSRGVGDMPQHRPFPEPQRSVPGHPSMRRALRRVFLFWRRGA